MASLRTAALCLLLALPGLSACAQRPPADDKEALAEFKENNDPLEPTNRAFFRANNFVDRNAVRPVAQTYHDHVPTPVRQHVHNVLSNLGNPVQFANDVMEAHPRKAGDTFMRFLINSTVGVVGVFDVASRLGYPDHDADFGLTLGVWGLPTGPFLFLPVLGPTNVRDAAAFGLANGLDPLTYVTYGGSASVGWSKFAVSAVDGRERVLSDTDSINKTALDPYATYRSLSRQHRQGELDAARADRPATTPSWYAASRAPRQGSAVLEGVSLGPASGGAPGAGAADLPPALTPGLVQQPPPATSRP